MMIKPLGITQDEKLGIVNRFYVEFSGIKGVIKITRYEDVCLMFSDGGLLLSSAVKRNAWADEVLKAIYKGDDHEN